MYGGIIKVIQFFNCIARNHAGATENLVIDNRAWFCLSLWFARHPPLHGIPDYTTFTIARHSHSTPFSIARHSTLHDIPHCTTFPIARHSSHDIFLYTFQISRHSKLHDITHCATFRIARHYPLRDIPLTGLVSLLKKMFVSRLDVFRRQLFFKKNNKNHWKKYFDIV